MTARNRSVSLIKRGRRDAGSSSLNSSDVSLTQPDRQLSLRLRHLRPQPLQIFLQRLIIRLLAQRQSKPAVSRRKIARHANARRIKRAQRNHRFRIRFLCSRSQHPQATIAVLSHPAPTINIFFAFTDLIERFRRGRFGSGTRFRGGCVRWSALGRLVGCSRRSGRIRIACGLIRRRGTSCSRRCRIRTLIRGSIRCVRVGQSWRSRRRSSRAPRRRRRRR